MADPHSGKGSVLEAVPKLAGEYALRLLINGQDAPRPPDNLLVGTCESNMLPSCGRNVQVKLAPLLYKMSDLLLETSVQISAGTQRSCAENVLPFASFLTLRRDREFRDGEIHIRYVLI